MKKLKPYTQYKKDLKRIRNNPKNTEALLKIPFTREIDITHK